ncbi:uncharacterized protein [Trachinotus anak]|uniref:uncharacterized protein n=1 Tax=Trachinotus anak TaxID=443729 RepID=UPI0039F264BE
MLIIFYLLLMLRVGRSTDEPIFETKTVRVGDNVTLTCTRKASGSLFWIRLVSGNFPEVLGKTYSLKTVHRHITTTEEPETFVLRIAKAELSDAALYYCMKTYQQSVTFLNGTDLRVKGTEPNVTATPTVLSEESLQSSTPSDFNNTEGNSAYGCDKNPEGISTEKCICSCSKNSSSSGAGTYFCAVATCEEIFPENRSKLDTEESRNPVLSLLCVALAISLIVIAYLIYSIKILKENSHGYYASVALQTNATANANQENQQTDEDSLVYSTPTFISRQTSASRAETRDTKTAEEENIYTDVRTLVLD